MVALYFSFEQLMSEETKVSILENHNTPLPSLTVCLEPDGDKDDGNVTLVQFMESKERLFNKTLLKGILQQMNASDHSRLKDNSFNPEPMLTAQHITVWNGVLMECITLDPPTSVLPSRLGNVTSIFTKS